MQHKGQCGGADLMHVLWEADVAVFKAHITTGPSEKVLDLFWIYDNKKELPENHRWKHTVPVIPTLSCPHSHLPVFPCFQRSCPMPCLPPLQPPRQVCTVLPRATHTELPTIAGGNSKTVRRKQRRITGSAAWRAADIVGPCVKASRPRYSAKAQAFSLHAT